MRFWKAERKFRSIICWGSSSSTVVEPMPHNQEFVGLNLAMRWTFFLSNESLNTCKKTFKIFCYVILNNIELALIFLSTLIPLDHRILVVLYTMYNQKCSWDWCKTLIPSINSCNTNRSKTCIGLFSSGDTIATVLYKIKSYQIWDHLPLT